MVSGSGQKEERRKKKEERRKKKKKEERRKKKEERRKKKEERRKKKKERRKKKEERRKKPSFFFLLFPKSDWRHAEFSRRSKLFWSNGFATLIRT